MADDLALEAEAPLPNPDVQADMLKGAGSRSIARGAHKQPEGLAQRISSPEEFELLPEGAKWIDPEGKSQIKPYMPKSPEDWKRVPEGATWLDPEGNVQTKPVFEDASVTANTLYNMAGNKAEQRKALDYMHPGKVKEDPAGDFYIEEADGKLYKPRGLLRAPLAGAIGGLLPTTGGIIGEVAGSALGPVGAVGGAAVGSAVGQGLNDFLLKSLGITDRTVTDEAISLGGAAAMGGVGTAVGRSIGTVGGALAQARKASPSAVANNILGVDPEGLEMGLNLVRQGVQYIPPSGYAKEAPHLINIAEVYDQAFHTQKPLLQAAQQHLERKGTGVLQELGAEGEIGSLTKPKAAVPLRETGEKVLATARAKAADADARLLAAQQQAMTPLEAQRAPLEQATQNRISTIDTALNDSRKAATGFIDAVYQDIGKDIDTAVKFSKTDRNSGDLWEGIAYKFQSLKRAFNTEAGKNYGVWENEYGHLKPPAAMELAPEAENFMAMLPPEFKAQNPVLIQRLAKLGGVRDPESGELIKPPTELTLQELHDLRNLFRYKIDWRTLQSDMMNGAAKKFEGRINDMLHVDKAAGRELDKIDAWYRENGRIYSEKRIQAVINGLEGGEPADPKVLYDTLVKEGRTDLNKKLEGMLGPNLWAGVRAADLDDIFRSAATTIEGSPSTKTVDANAFVREVMNRHRNGMLESVHGKEVARKLLSQVENLKLLNGDLPIDVRPGDKFTDIIAKMQAAQADLKNKAATDPLRLLNDEINTMRQAQTKELRQAQGQRRSEPLGFLYKPSMGAEEAVEKILAKPDTILAAEKLFGRESDEFKSLQLAWAQRVLQSSMDPSGKLTGLSEEVQRVLLPGMSYKMMRELADEMSWLMNTKAAKGAGVSIAAQERVEHPWSALLGAGAKYVPKLIPGVDAVGRYMLASYYGAVRSLMSKQWLLEFLQKGVGSMDPAVRAATRDAMRAEISKASAVAGATGAGAAQMMYQTPGMEE